MVMFWVDWFDVDGIAAYFLVSVVAGLTVAFTAAKSIERILGLFRSKI